MGGSRRTFRVWAICLTFFLWNWRFHIITLKQNLQHNVYCLASIYVSPQATIDPRSIICGIMSRNRRLMWDRSAPASPLHSTSSAQQEQHFNSAERSSFKSAGISSWFLSRLFPKTKGCLCYLCAKPTLSSQAGLHLHSNAKGQNPQTTQMRLTVVSSILDIQHI